MRKCFECDKLLETYKQGVKSDLCWLCKKRFLLSLNKNLNAIVKVVLTE